MGPINLRVWIVSVIKASLLLIFFTSCQEVKLVKEIDVIEDIVVPKQYIVGRSEGELIIDGKADESSWRTAIYTELFIDIEGEKTPEYETKCKMLWDDDYLYIYAWMEEPHIWGDITTHDAIMFYNNDFEVFISPTGNTRPYGEIEINALGTVWDLLLDKAYRDGGRPVSNWELAGMQSAIHVSGTINNPGDIDEFWAVEMAIPMEGLLELIGEKARLPVDGDLWRINFSRVQWDHELVNGEYKRKKGDSGKYLPEYNWVWSPQKVINMHEPEKWGYLQFSEQSDVHNIDIKKDELLYEKQVAFALYRQYRYGNLKDMIPDKPGDMTELKAWYNEESYLDCKIMRTWQGMDFKVKATNLKREIFIDESGKMRIN